MSDDDAYESHFSKEEEEEDYDEDRDDQPKPQGHNIKRRRLSLDTSEEEEEEEVDCRRNIDRLLKCSKSNSTVKEEDNVTDNDNNDDDDDDDEGDENHVDDDQDSGNNHDDQIDDQHDDVGPKRKRIKKQLMKKNSSNIQTNSNNSSKKSKTKTNNSNTNNNNHHKEDNNNNNNQDDAQSQDNMEVRFLVSSRDAGAIIGRGGSNITHLRQTYESSITVPDCLSPERVLTIVASVDKITKIIREILKFIDSTLTVHSASANSSSRSASRFSGKSRKASEQGSSSRNNNNNTGSNLSEIRLLLHTSHAGGLIGKGGSRITELREETKAGIKVYSECCPQSTERVCSIIGPMDIVTSAVTKILNLIRTFPIRGPNQLYNPSNFDPFMSIRYGGYGESTQPPSQSHEHNRNSIFSPPPIPPPPPAQYHHPTPPIHNPFSSSNRLSALNGPSALLDTRTPPEFASSSFMSHWPPGSGRMAFARGAPAPGVAPTNAADVFAPNWMADAKHYDASRLQNSLMKRDDVSIMINQNGIAISTIKVNHKVVGAIIGKGGNRIKEIRIKTKADISIDQMKNSSSGGSSGTNTRYITVKGLYNDVQAAVSMICNCIDENRNI